MSDLPPVLTAEELAERWSVKVSEIWRLCRLGKLGHMKVGRYIRIPRAVVLAEETQVLKTEESERRSSI